MIDIEKLIKDLRDKYTAYDATGNHKSAQIFKDAADAIEALQADIKRLKEANDELREKQTYIDHYGDRWMTSAKDVPTEAYKHGYADGWDEARANMEVQDESVF
jgi:FtsZ-binding cell division protein ZapB